MFARPYTPDRLAVRVAASSVFMAAALFALHVLSTPSAHNPIGECPLELAGPDYTTGCHLPPPNGLNQALVQAAAEYGVDPWVLAVTVYRESGCDQYALGAVGEVGLTQINPTVWMSTLKAEGIANRPQELYDVNINLRASAYSLAYNHKAASGSLFGTFRRYNGSGPKARHYAREQVAAYTQIASSTW